jgi:4-amino-4-deoxy-L-arabinose transferase-like glycosyltransferase
MKKLFNPFLLLFGIVVIALTLRFYQLGVIPPALTWDEVAWGYNSYSLGLDGRDEFGAFLPYAYIESFGDFKPPLYAYAGIIPIKIWGLTEFAVRFPSALFGVLTVLLTYFLTREIFSSSSRKEYYALFASFLLAISPWHINLSRAAFEANIAQFFIVTGIFLFLMALRRNMWLLSLSAVSFVLSFYTFNTARVFVPIIVTILGLVFIKKLWKYRKQTIFAGIVGFFLLLPIVGFLFSPQAGLRFREVNIFTDSSIVERANQEIENDNNSLISKTFHNRRIKYAVSFVSHYFDHFSPAFLFIKGDGNPKFSTQDVGQLYIWSIPFLVIGGFILFRKREGKWWLVPVWLLAGIIPAATARETPHALRIETVLPTFQILIAYGFVSSMIFFKEKIKKPVVFKMILAGLFLLLLANLGYYLYGYYTHYAREYSGEWQYGYKEAMNYAVENEDNYDQIYMTDKLGRPYIYYLFYANVAPNNFRTDANIQRDVFGFVNVLRVGKYNFAKDFQIDNSGGKFLFIDDPLNVPQNAFVLKKINKLDGEPSLIIYTK